jgi:hypothetical protein
LTRTQASKPASFSAGKTLSGRLKPVEIAEQVAEGVTKFAIGLGEAIGDGVRELNVFGEIDGGNPETQQIGAEFLDDFFGLDDVAERLRHGAAVGIERPTVGDTFAIGRCAFEAHAGEQ